MAARRNIKGGANHFTVQEAQNVALWQAGCVFSDDNSTALVPPAGHVFIAITAMANATFDASGGLVASDPDRFMNTEAAATAGGTGGVQMDASNSIPQGMTIYGRWKSINLAGGEIIAYIGK